MKLLLPIMLSVALAPASAAIITFDAIPSGAFTGQAVEDGFLYSVAKGGLYVNDVGHPFQDMEGSDARGGGVLAITAVDGSLFSFAGIDYAPYSSSGNGSQTLTITGFLCGFQIGAAQFTLANTSSYMPQLANWTKFGSGGLSGVELDRVTIDLAADQDSDQNIDNVRLGLASVPEPATWLMLILGFGAVGVVRRRPVRVETAM